MGCLRKELIPIANGPYVNARYTIFYEITCTKWNLMPMVTCPALPTTFLQGFISDSWPKDSSFVVKHSGCEIGYGAHRLLFLVSASQRTRLIYWTLIVLHSRLLKGQQVSLNSKQKCANSLTQALLLVYLSNIFLRGCFRSTTEERQTVLNWRNLL